MKQAAGTPAAKPAKHRDVLSQAERQDGGEACEERSDPLSIDEPQGELIGIFLKSDEEDP